ncbi:HemK family protein methyltransferase [Candidatus Saccharibacteria bacterium]|nr:HemK family protein methyltransferase [Candidatus Saccharibacteria bacterium]
MTKDFYGREFFVGSDVLIPRLETEAAIDLALSLAGKPYLPGLKVPERRLPARPRILDVGTGSGCIATTLKLELEEAEVFACDISDSALEVAKQNARALGASVSFLKSDLLKDIEGNFDLVVANLPYVDRTWDWLDLKSLAKEPELALFAEDGGLKLIKSLLDEALHRTKFLILEADPCQHEKILAYNEHYRLIKTSGFQLLFRVLGEC